MSSDAIRMSLRPRRADKGVFKVGDVVEVTYRNGIELGTLLGKVNSDKWVVKYKNNNLHEMQVSQTAFGRLLKRCSSDEESVSEKRKRSLRDKRARDRRNAIDNMNRKGTSRRGKKRKKPTSSKEEKNKEKPSVVNKTPEKENIEKDSVKTNKHSDRSVKSNRSGRSARCQSKKLKEEHERPEIPSAIEESKVLNTDEPTLSAREKRLQMRREAADEGTEDEPHKAKSKKAKTNNTIVAPRDKEEVVKVKMNTGTLYLYRGSNPRAVFIRRY